MDSLDNLWSFMEETDIDMGAELLFNDAESDGNEDDLFDLFSEEGSSSSSDFADSTVHHKHDRGLLRAACTKLLRAPKTVKGTSPECSPPRSSCLGKRDRNHELKGVKVCSKEKGAGVKESKWAVQLLNNCSQAIASNNVQRIQHFMWVLNDLASLTGDANQRLAAYGLKALFGKVAGTVAAASAYHQSAEMESLLSSPKSLQNALLKFHDVHPWHQMVYSVTNGVLMDKLEGRDVIHVIDIGIAQGIHWPTLIEALATRPSGPPSVLRLTLVEEEDCASNASSVKNRLEKFAKVMGLNLDFRLIASPLSSLTKESFQLSEGETLAVCAHFRMSRLYEADGERDQFLKFLRSELNPELVILGDNDSDNTSKDFATVSREVFEHFWRFLDSINSAFKSEDCQERRIIEHLIAMGVIENTAAGLEKNETCSSWKVRMINAGFVPDSPHDEVIETVRMQVKKNDLNWEVRTEENNLVLLWKHQPATFCSVWKC